MEVIIQAAAGGHESAFQYFKIDLSDSLSRNGFFLVESKKDFRRIFDAAGFLETVGPDICAFGFGAVRFAI